MICQGRIRSICSSRSKRDMWSKLPKEMKGYHTRNRTIKSLWEQKKQEVFNKENCQDQSIDANHQYIYECYMCNKKADRKKVVFCGICQNWIHSDCAKLDASLAQKVPIFCCVSCIRSTFGPFCNYIAFRKKRADLLQRKKQHRFVKTGIYLTNLLKNPGKCTILFKSTAIK